MSCARGGAGRAPPPGRGGRRRAALRFSRLFWAAGTITDIIWRRCGVSFARPAGRGLLCARSGAIRITLLSRLATLARLHGSSISICSRPSALRPPVPSPSTVECTHSGVCPSVPCHSFITTRSLHRQHTHKTHSHTSRKQHIQAMYCCTC